MGRMWRLHEAGLIPVSRTRPCSRTCEEFATAWGKTSETSACLDIGTVCVLSGSNIPFLSGRMLPRFRAGRARVRNVDYNNAHETADEMFPMLVAWTC